MTNVFIIWEACKVKQAAFIKVLSRNDAGFRNPTEFFLKHYNTTLLRGYYDTDDKPVVMDMFIGRRTHSNDRAISQVLQYLKINKTPTEIQEQIKAYRRRITLET
jgi:hypothetical protein